MDEITESLRISYVYVCERVLPYEKHTGMCDNVSLYCEVWFDVAIQYHTHTYSDARTKEIFDHQYEISHRHTHTQTFAHAATVLYMYMYTFLTYECLNIVENSVENVILSKKTIRCSHFDCCYCWPFVEEDFKIGWRFCITVFWNCTGWKNNM